MILDKQNTYTGDAADPLVHTQQILASGASEHVIDHTVNDIGPGEPVALVVQVTEDFDDGSMTVILETAANEAFVGATAIATSYDITDLTAGAKFALFALPSGLLRYSRVNFTITGAPTTGRVYAGLVKDVQYGFAR
jgi:hypothetical protein